MSNQLVKRMELTEMMQIGKVFAESGMFADAKSAAQAIVKIQAGQEFGIQPFAAMTGIHIIQGKPSIGANLMASAIKSSGKYTYKVIQQDEKACILDFYEGAEKLGTSTFTIADAQKAKCQNLEKFPRNMLFARAISNGVRWYCPDVFNAPVYTPEELGANVTEDGSPIFTETAPQGTQGEKPTIIKKKKLTDAKYKEALEAVKIGAKLPNSEVSFYTFLINDCELTTEQISEVESASQPM